MERLEQQQRSDDLAKQQQKKTQLEQDEERFDRLEKMARDMITRLDNDAIKPESTAAPSPSFFR